MKRSEEQDYFKKSDTSGMVIKATHIQVSYSI